MGGGIGSEGEVMFFGGVAQSVEHDAGLHAGDAARGIDLEDFRHVLGKIQHDGDVAALAGERRASAATQQGRAEFAANGNCGQHVVDVVGKNHADGDLTIVRAVGGVEGAAAVVKANFAANARAQSLGQPRSVSS